MRARCDAQRKRVPSHQHHRCAGPHTRTESIEAQHPGNAESETSHDLIGPGFFLRVREHGGMVQFANCCGIQGQGRAGISKGSICRFLGCTSFQHLAAEPKWPSTSTPSTRHGVRNGKGNGGGFLLVVDSGVFGWCYVDWVVFILFDLILRIFPGLTLTGRFLLRRPWLRARPRPCSGRP